MGQAGQGDETFTKVPRKLVTLVSEFPVDRKQLVMSQADRHSSVRS